MKDKPEIPSSEEDQAQFVKDSALYKEFLAERPEILRHKWIESEKAGKDIGFERALLDWIVNIAPTGESGEGRRRAPKSPPPNFFPLTRSREVAKETHEANKTEFIRRGPGHGRGSNSSRASTGCARNYRAKPAA